MDEDMVLWLEDQRDDFLAYSSALFRAGYKVDTVRSVTDAVRKLREKKYIATIFDIKVLAGDDETWINLDKKKLVENPDIDSYLGLELLRALFKSRKARVELSPPVEIDPQKVIVMSVVHDRVDEIVSFGVPREQVIYKAVSNMKTLPQLIGKILNGSEE